MFSAEKQPVWPAALYASAPKEHKLEAIGLATALGTVRVHEQDRVRQIEVMDPFRQNMSIHNSKAEEAVAMNLVAEPPQTDTATQVLIIDDEHTVTDVVADLLELEGIPALTSNDGADAVDLYRQHQDEIGLVILDLTMPGMNGREVFEALRGINPDVNVMISSGFGPKEVSRHIAPEALAGILQKPFDVFTLISEIRTHL